jgi:hypothetical protein
MSIDEIVNEIIRLVRARMGREILPTEPANHA